MSIANWGWKHYPGSEDRSMRFWLDHPNAGDEEKSMDDLMDDLMDENKRLRAALEDAIECVESWGAYASEYFQNKHALAGDLERLRAALK